MAGSRAIQCIGPSYHLADRKSAVQRTVNLYMREVEGVGEDLQVVLDSAPGLVEYADLGATVRGSYATDTRWFVAAGQQLYELTSGSAVSMGSLASTSGFVSMCHGRDQLVAVDGQNGYVLRLNTDDFAQITDSDWRGADHVVEIDGYFVFVDPDTDQFYLSAIDDATSLDALDFSSADKQPDNIVTHRVHKSELVFLGTTSGEFWVNSGDADFPFVRYNSTPMDVGIVGKRAVVGAADTLFWVGQTKSSRGIVYMLVGHQPVPVSDAAVHEALQAPGVDLSQCVLSTYQRGKNEFVCVNAPGMSTTWCYDAVTKQWHERARLDNGEFAPRQDEAFVLFGGQVYTYFGTKIYRVDPSAYTLAGDPLVRERTWPHLRNPSMEPIAFRGLELGCTTGYGGNISLTLSNDGGTTWGPPLLRSLGAIGQWMQRVRWLNLGSAHDRVFRLRCSEAVPLTIHQAAVDA
ncbi:MAG: packaged DNA stabilization protein [Mycobacterium sp.]|nr:packaged DNA stabilization protein [Mycobacterium sp.]